MLHKKNKTNSELSEFLALLESILKRPGMYTVNRVEDLAYIISGFHYAQKGSKNEELNDFMFSFRKFVNEKFQSESDFDWIRLVRLYSSNDQHSLVLFSETFKSFLESYSVK